MSRAPRVTAMTLNATFARRPNLSSRYLAAGQQAGRAAIARSRQAGDTDLPAVMISGHGNIETGRRDQIGRIRLHRKPFKADRLVLVADRVENYDSNARSAIKQLAPVPSKLVGRSATVASCDRRSSASHRLIVALKVGPSGAGKEPRRGPFISSQTRKRSIRRDNAAAITPERMEIELFGVDQSNGSEGRRRSGRGPRRYALRRRYRRTAARDPERDLACARRPDVKRWRQHQDCRRCQDYFVDSAEP